MLSLKTLSLFSKSLNRLKLHPGRPDRRPSDPVNHQHRENIHWPLIVPESSTASGPGMATTLCNRCGDAGDEEYDPKDELAELDTLLKRLRLERCAASSMHQPSPSFRRYVDNFRVLPAIYYGSPPNFSLNPRGLLFPAISWSHLQLLEKYCSVSA